MKQLLKGTGYVFYALAVISVAIASHYVDLSTERLISMGIACVFSITGFLMVESNNYIKD